MHAPFLACIRSRKNKTARASGRLFEETRFRNSVFRASSGSAAQGTVASPGPVAGSDVTIGPLLMLVHLLSVAIGRCQRYSGTVSRHDSQGGGSCPVGHSPSHCDNSTGKFISAKTIAAWPSYRPGSAPWL